MNTGAGARGKFFWERAIAMALLLLSWMAAHPVEAKTSLREKANDLEKRGKYLTAVKVYKKILRNNKTKAGSEEMLEIRRAYQAVRVKHLLSKAKKKKGPNHTVVEGDTLYELAKKYGTTTDLIKWNNDLKNDALYPGMKLKMLQEIFSVQVDKSDNQLVLLLGDKRVKRYPVATGVENKTPAGNFKIINKVEHPTWYRTGAVVPPGSPHNSLGARWMGFDLQGYGIHGTIEPESIGKHVSLGCVRMHNEDVEELYALLPVGTQVTIAD